MEKGLKIPLDRRGIRQIVEVISNGGVVVLPTDTIYGFHCAVFKRNAIERVLQLKGRSVQKCFILLSGDMDMVDRVISDWPYDSKKVLSEIWPAPLTAILPASNLLPDYVVSDGKVAIRIPDRPWLREIVSLVGEPLVSTSVNRTGRRPITRIREIKREFSGLDMYVSSQGRPSGMPSTLVDFTGRVPLILREGKYRFRV